MKFELNCSTCGNNRFSLNEAVTDDCEVSCLECGHAVGKLGLLKERVAEEIMLRAASAKSAPHPES